MAEHERKRRRRKRETQPRVYATGSGVYIRMAHTQRTHTHTHTQTEAPTRSTSTAEEKRTAVEQTNGGTKRKKGVDHESGALSPSSPLQHTQLTYAYAGHPFDATASHGRRTWQCRTQRGHTTRVSGVWTLSTNRRSNPLFFSLLRAPVRTAAQVCAATRTVRNTNSVGHQGIVRPVVSSPPRSIPHDRSPPGLASFSHPATRRAPARTMPKPRSALRIRLRVPGSPSVAESTRAMVTRQVARLRALCASCGPCSRVVYILLRCQLGGSKAAAP